jgi:hypothetical protein
MEHDDISSHPKKLTNQKNKFKPHIVSFSLQSDDLQL